MKLLVLLGLSVLVIALAALPLTAPASAQECHSSYQGDCLDLTVSDYDCIGGSGDGPGYAYQVTVVGDDPFGLDDDGDGIGCESSPVRPASPAPEGEQQPAPEGEVADVAKAPSAGFGPGPIGGGTSIALLTAAGLSGAGLAWVASGLLQTTVGVGAQDNRAKSSGFVPRMKRRK